MSDEGKSRTVTGDSENQNQYYYGTFQGVANYYPPSAPQPPPQPAPYQPVIGFPQNVSPPAVTGHPPHHHHHHYQQGYQAVPGYAVIEAIPYREAPLPCCGIGFGWFLFIIGFLLGGIPWYLGAFILLCARVDYREKPGYLACVLASVLLIIAITMGVTKGAHEW